MIELILLGLTVVLLIIFIPRLARAMRERADQARASLAARGYVIEPSHLKGTGYLTRLWGKFDTPTAFYWQLSNLDPIQNLAGAAGIADLRVGHPKFDSAFVVRSSHPDLARAILDPDLCNHLLTLGLLRFRTGSIDSLLGADYFPENRDTRDLREYWMLEFRGKPEAVDTVALLDLGRRLTSAVAALPCPVTDPKSLRTGFFEGR
jgi:hypothetical protein